MSHDVCAVIELYELVYQPRVCRVGFCEQPGQQTWKPTPVSADCITDALVVGILCSCVHECTTAKIRLRNNVIEHFEDGKDASADWLVGSGIHGGYDPLPCHLTSMPQVFHDELFFGTEIHVHC